MQRVIKLAMSAVLSISVLSLVSVFNAEAKSAKVDVQYIAVHFGNTGHADVMDKSEFSKFSFYTAPGSVFAYTEKQKMMGSPKYLTGWYGEVPEKMGFSANYNIKKSYSRSYQRGVTYVISPDGIISYQLTSQRVNPENYSAAYDKEMGKMKKAIKKLRKGKTVVKPLAKKKCKYLKKAPMGELESKKGSKIDKKEKGLIGWPVPDLDLINKSGKTVNLKDIAKDKVTVLVFYTLNGVHWKKGDKKGKIIKEWDGQKLINSKTYRTMVNKKVTGEVNEKKNSAPIMKHIGKGLLKGGAFGNVGKIAGDLDSTKEELSNEEKAKAYIQAISLLKMAD